MAELSDWNKSITLVFLPVMIELELMGYNPIEYFLPTMTMEQIERKYIAIQRAKRKYPQWNRVVSAFITKIFNG